MHLFNAINININISLFSIKIDIISIDQMLRNIMFTMVKNTPSGGTLTIKFTIKEINKDEKIRTTNNNNDNNNNDNNSNYNNNNINKSSLNIEFSYINALSQDHDGNNDEEEDNNNINNNNRDFNVVIFDPTKPLLNKNDSGMDLWIANKIIEAHHGYYCCYY